MSRHGKRRRTSPEESYDMDSYDTAAFAADTGGEHDDHAGDDRRGTPGPPDSDPAVPGSAPAAPAAETYSDAATVHDADAASGDAPPPASGRIRRPDPEPLEADDVKIVGIGTLVWFGLFLLCLPFRDTLERDGREWWPWCALAGAGLGLLGLWYVRRRRDAIRRRADQSR
ncbi:hypothetical protein [Streptodolium elevatio]